MFYSLQYQCKYETRVHSAVPRYNPCIRSPRLGSWPAQPAPPQCDISRWELGQGRAVRRRPPASHHLLPGLSAPPPPLIAADMLMMRNGEFRAWCLPQHARHKVTLRPWRILPQETKRKLIYENDNEHECSGKITILEFGEILLSLPPLGIKSEHFSVNNLFSFFFSI